MSYIETFALKNSTIMYLYAERDGIKLDPPYQRMGGIWTTEKKQLLIDSIINDYDMPKLYFHEYSRDQREQLGMTHAVVDGRQRLQTIWDFIDGRFVLSKDFEYQRDNSLSLGGLSYDDIAKAHPKIRIAFDSFVLPVVGIRTDDEDLIEDMFSRLNEAVPLNAAEKRNALGGNMVSAIRRVSGRPLFTNRVRFGNNRYQHMEVAARMLLVEDSLHEAGRLIDTKKVYLDALARKYREGQTNKVDELERKVVDVISSMEAIFAERDELLQAQGNMIVYYLITRSAIRNNEESLLSRRRLLDFRDALRANRLRAAEEYADSSYELLEYDRLSQQGTNDASNLKERYEILADYLGLTEKVVEA